MHLHKSTALQPARACAWWYVCMHVHEDAFVRVAWGRLPFADSVSGVARGGGLLGPVQPASPVDR